MTCQCLLSSLSINFLKLLTSDSSEYHLPPIIPAHGAVPSGPLLLKMIISQAHVDSRATVSFIRSSLAKLDNKMIEVDSNIEAFNFYVKAQVKALSARGETSSDLLVNLFRGYKVANDTEFFDFIRRKENSYEEGEDVNTNNLMAAALAKYKSRQLTGEWSAPTKEQGQILALTAQLEQLKTAKPSSHPSGSAPHTKNKKRKKDKKWAWKDTLPADGEPTTKLFEGKKYHINCKYHPKQWVCHSSEECSKKPSGTDSTSTSSTAGSESTGASRRLKAAQLAAALLEDSGESGEDSQEDDL